MTTEGKRTIWAQTAGQRIEAGGSQTSLPASFSRILSLSELELSVQSVLAWQRNLVILLALTADTNAAGRLETRSLFLMAPVGQSTVS